VFNVIKIVMIAVSKLKFSTKKMKTIFFTLIAIFLFALKAKCQYLIIKTNNDSVKVEIIEEKRKAYLCLRLERPKIYINIKKSDIKNIIYIDKDTTKNSKLTETKNESVEKYNNRENAGDYLKSAGNNFFMAEGFGLIGAALLVVNLGRIKPDPSLTIGSLGLQMVGIILNFSAANRLANAGRILKQEQLQFVKKEKAK